MLVIVTLGDKETEKADDNSNSCHTETKNQVDSQNMITDK
ncbi:Internalin [Bacillus thuringiensis MC28]|nr:Internalin [Bacillus thuringiensis MC28]